MTTEQTIARFQEVTRLDPGVLRDWVELDRLYQSAGRLPDARIAAQHASDTARSERDQEVALNEMGDIEEKQGDMAAAPASYRKAIGIAETLAGRDPGNTDGQRDLSVCYARVGDLQAKQGDLAAALASYRQTLAIAETRVGRDPGNAQWQRDLIVSLVKGRDDWPGKGLSATCARSCSGAQELWQTGTGGRVDGGATPEYGG